MAKKKLGAAWTMNPWRVSCPAGRNGSALSTRSARGFTGRSEHRCHFLSIRRPCPKGKVRRSRSHPLRAVVEQVVGPDIQCGCKGVQVGVHESLRFDVGLATPILGTLPAPPSTTHQLYPLE